MNMKNGIVRKDITVSLNKAVISFLLGLKKSFIGDSQRKYRNIKYQISNIKYQIMLKLLWNFLN
ncbi:hypothetical protein [Haloimpatiens lingqiaonensis]|uniref:hypothetical protein n=1 Tax=Haloimpatiens lingqiaonensis TaxID=1380675 RepID=UPI0014851167|nr:hypothetical protein [Haloimpatiens lingqiaonensis]